MQIIACSLVLSGKQQWNAFYGFHKFDVKGNDLARRRSLFDKNYDTGLRIPENSTLRSVDPEL